jgi:hypothetical protein
MKCIKQLAECITNAVFLQQLHPTKLCVYHDSQIIAYGSCAMISRVGKLFQTSQTIFHEVRRLHNSKIKNLDSEKLTI